MGLLDDAIREHLELKRRRGADPSEVAREQREVLDTSYEPQGDPDVDDHGDAISAVADAEAATMTPEEPAVAGETAELDMRTVLADDGAATAAEEDSLEWEMPARGSASAADEPA
jgi:hypothetical protein